MKIYLASPFFNEKELENVKITEKILTERGFSLFSPRLNEVRTDEITQQSWWSKETFMNVVGALSENVQNAKDWFQSKKNGKESIETKEDE